MGGSGGTGGESAHPQTAGIAPSQSMEAASRELSLVVNTERPAKNGMMKGPVW